MLLPSRRTVTLFSEACLKRCTAYSSQSQSVGDNESSSSSPDCIEFPPTPPVYIYLYCILDCRARDTLDLLSIELKEPRDKCFYIKKGK